jgi:phospholipid N-methyltransferase
LLKEKVIIIEIEYGFKLILWDFAGAVRIFNGENFNANNTISSEHDYVHNDPIKV